MATLANGLTDAQQLSCFEIANVIWTDATTATVQNGFGVLLTLTDLSTLQTDLSNRLAALSAAAVVRVAALIVKWDLVSTDTSALSAGAVDDVSGIAYDPEADRQQIKRMFCTYVPCMGMALAQARKNDAAPKESSVIGIMRG